MSQTEQQSPTSGAPTSGAPTSEVPATEVPATEPRPSEAGAVQPAAAAGQTSVRTRFESKFPRGLVIRLIAYLFVGHLFAFFVYLLFVLGGRNQ
ncbi:DUF6126 family protein [Streptomyces sp. NPDC006544]|uniref:DUF6126 family protein n=1 Tax=Streptomyces sp. NPDC006544 TaxID=3154583 RepID=UPI0033A26C63